MHNWYLEDYVLYDIRNIWYTCKFIQIVNVYCIVLSWPFEKYMHKPILHIIFLIPLLIDVPLQRD